MQRRLALLGETVFILALGFYVVGLAIHSLVLGLPVGRFWTERGNQMHLTGAAVMGLLWLVCRLRPLSLGTLRILDVVSLMACCVAWAFMFIPDYVDSITIVLLADMATVTARAMVVPSTARRTFSLTLAAMAPVLVVQLMFMRPPASPFPSGTMMLAQGISTASWIAVGVTVATVASSVIYGLRKEVEAARDLGQYTLEEKIGSGGMGEVWRGRHRMLIRPAAIKLIRPSALGSTPEAPDVLMRRFEREARATAALKSPYTVQLYDFGLAEDGTLYYVMELLGGIDLEKLVARFGPVPAARAIHILKQACLSLADAHQNGLIHRDVKPSNIFVNCFGGVISPSHDHCRRCACAPELDFVKVVDFGLVKLSHRREVQPSLKLTALGAASGTPAYMAPEIVLGEAEFDHRVDLYSLGCVGYWLLTGKLVFEGNTAMKVMLHHAHTTPRRPSTRTELAIPAALDDLIMACLEKDPNRRPASAAEMAARLDACEVAEPWTTERAERWWRAHLPERTHLVPVAEMLRMEEMRR